MIKKLLIVTSAVLALSACEQPVETIATVRPVLAMKVTQKHSHTAEFTLAGEVTARYTSKVGFRVPGKITKRYVDVGDVVKKGQVLARIDHNDANLNAQAASADVAAAKAQHRLAQQELERSKQLFAKKFISKSALDRQLAQYDASLAQLKQAKSHAVVSGNQSVYTRLVADKAGMIAQVKAEPGQVVSAGQPIATIIDLQSLEVAIPVPESAITQLQLGDLVTVHTWANASKVYHGKVREIPPAANAKTRAFDVRVSIVDADDAVKVGMTAEVGFVESSDATAHIMIPSAAVTAKKNQTVAWVITKEGYAKMQAIEIGEFSEHGIPIISGLQVGDTVAIAGVHKLIEGQLVRPVFQQTNRKY